MKYFGIDLGTSKCSVAYAVNSARPNFTPQPTVVEFRVKPLDAAKTPVVPSVIARLKGQTLFAFEAQEAVGKGQVLGRNCQEMFRSVKSHLGTGRSYVRADSTLNTPVKVWAALIRRLCEMTVAEKGPEFDPRQHPTVLTVPASFGTEQRKETLEAAALAGFSTAKEASLVQLIDEPVAALIDYLNHPDCDLHVNPQDLNTVLVFDFGGGNCDLTLLEFRYDASKPTGIDARSLAISPYQQIGGDTVDLAIMDKVVWPQICRQNGIKRHQLTATQRKQIEDSIRFTDCRRLKELVNESLLREPEQFRRQDWAGIPPVSQPLSNRLRVSEDKELCGDATLSARDLYEVMLPFIEPNLCSETFAVGESKTCRPFAKLVEITMERAGMTPDELDILVLHGGSCVSPFIRWGFERMKEEGVLAKSCKILETPDLNTSVARGAALFGCLSKKHGAPYIRPIVPEELWIETKGKDFECLVYGGQELPYKKTFEKFYLSSADQEEIVVPIYVGYDAERRELASTLRIPITQKHLPQSHEVEIELEIDTDKISRWRFRLKGYDWSDAYEVANPWNERQPSDEIKKLHETRDEIRAAIDRGSRPPVWMLSNEAIQAARAGYPEEGLALIEDVAHANDRDCNAWNIKALIHHQRGEYQRSLESYEKASELDPNNMLIRGNYGTTLMRLKRYQEAVAVMREALSKSPTLTYLHSWLVEAFQAIGDVKECDKELERWRAHAERQTVLRPEEVATWEELRSVAIRLGRYEDADEATEEIHALCRPRNLLAGAKHG